MAHNFGQVKTPRVYLDFNNYFLNTGGVLHPDADPNKNQQFAYLDPYTSKVIDTPAQGQLITYAYYKNESNAERTAINYIPNLKINYCALLSHELNCNRSFAVKYTADDSTVANDFEINPDQDHLNAVAGTVSNSFYGTNHGSNIVHFKDTIDNMSAFAVFVAAEAGNVDNTPSTDSNVSDSIGAISIGEYMDFPQSPDMNVSMERRFENVETFQTISGKSFSRSTYGSPTFCHGEQPFGLYNYGSVENAEGDLNLASHIFNKFRRTGRRVWSVSFSQIGADDMFHAYESGTLDLDTEQSGITDSNLGNINTWKGVPILSDSPIFKLYTYTKGLQLPFIWMPDKDDVSPNGYCIAKIDAKSFNVSQESFERYSISFDVIEQW